MKRYYLALTRGSLQTSVQPLLGVTTIGRGAENTIIIEEPTASRSHARISFQDGAWTVEDLGSRNGITVGGRRIQRMPLEPGDSFQIGAISFRFLEKDLEGRREHLAQTVEILSAAIEGVGSSTEVSKPGPSADKLKQAIAGIPFFASLGGEELDKLAETATLHVFQAGEMIIREGDPGRSVFLILHGRVRVFTRDYKGNDLELAVLDSSQFFGEMSFLTGKPRSSYVAALEDSVLVELSYTAMYDLVRAHPEVKDTLVKYFRERIESLREKREELSMPDRRQNDRIRAQVEVILNVRSESEGPDKPKPSSYTAYSRDISMAGVLVECEKAAPDCLAIGSQLGLQLRLPPPWGEVRAVGTVRRFQIVTAEAKTALVAVEFKAMPSEDIQKLKRFLHGESQLASES